jgi:ABC-type sugar transport system permease subunit
MRIEHKRELELARRKGLTRRTILAVLWLAICFAAAYFVTEWLFENDIITYNGLYARLFIPRWVDQIFLQIGLMIVLVIIVQFFVLIGYGLLSFAGRRRPGEASLYSDDPDPGEDIFRYN